MHDYSKIDYLENGNDKQKAAFKAIEDLKILEILAKHNPLMTGTIPLGIDHDKSDIDLVCEASNLEEFYETLENNFAQMTEFNIKNNKEYVVCNFKFHDLEFEIFGENQASHLQNAYVHLLGEAKLLELGGNEAFLSLKELKSQGEKTEPAFKKYFNLPGDAYQVLLKIGLLPLDDIKKYYL